MALSLPGRKKDLSSTKKEDVNIASVKRDNPKQENPSQDQKVDWAVVLLRNQDFKSFEVEFPVTSTKYTVSTMDVFYHLKNDPENAVSHLDAFTLAQKETGSHDRYLQSLAKDIAVKWAQEELLAGKSLYRQSPETASILEKLNMFDRTIMDAFDKVRDFYDYVPDMMDKKAYQTEKLQHKKIQNSFRDEAEVLLYKNFKIKENVELGKYPNRLDLWNDIKASVDAINNYMARVRTIIA